jgi:hypothetical protein
MGTRDAGLEAGLMNAQDFLCVGKDLGPLEDPPRIAWRSNPGI